jgi:hypothetical protein
MCCFNAARSLLVRSLDNPENCFLAGTSGPFDLPIADVTVHILGETANEGFIGFNLTAHLRKGARLHCQPDTMIHEPSGFAEKTAREVSTILFGVERQKLRADAAERESKLKDQRIEQVREMYRSLVNAFEGRREAAE